MGAGGRFDIFLDSAFNIHRFCLSQEPCYDQQESLSLELFLILITAGLQRVLKHRAIVNVFSAYQYTFLVEDSFFSPSAETFLALSQSQYQNFLNTFVAKIFEFQCFAHAHNSKAKKFHVHLK